MLYKKIAPHIARGKKGEQIAEQYLRTQGIDIVAKNVRFRRGEIDLIGHDADTLIFVEVRLRKQGALVSAAESITLTKQLNLKRAAQEFISQHYPKNPPDCRFDAVLITQDKNQYNIEWLRGISI